MERNQCGDYSCGQTAVGSLKPWTCTAVWLCCKIVNLISPYCSFWHFYIPNCITLENYAKMNVLNDEFCSKMRSTYLNMDTLSPYGLMTAENIWGFFVLKLLRHVITLSCKFILIYSQSKEERRIGRDTERNYLSCDLSSVVYSWSSSWHCIWITATYTG